ncbi:MAG: 4-hydroxythreonine-4-phosphate dehydrogenase PdxA [Sedimentisphaerales bacterium]|nr:4-hydroxythreonine-4-phosphate dehydrogenase PdxA [Sedimentisphaerales bacterium]
MNNGNGHSIGNEIVIGITMGDPGGIGPEIIVKALSDPLIRREAKFIIFGMDELLGYAADAAEIDQYWKRHQHEKLSRGYPRQVVVADYDDYGVPAWIHRPNKIAGEASMRFCKDAINAARDGIIDAVVTAPISKVSWKLAGGSWPGHTEMLAELCKSPRKAMMFVAGPLRVALATIHEALFSIRHKFTIGCVFEPIDLLDTALKEYFGIKRPKIAVAGLNPHAGEDGQFGDEEKRIISPAVLLAQEVGINCSGPYPADTLFLRAMQGEFDGVVAMYHDQGMIPVKMCAFNSAVNVTIGIPIIRTSPCHGTAFDIACKGIANPASMIEAIHVAIEMAKKRRENDLAVKTENANQTTN